MMRFKPVLFLLLFALVGFLATKRHTLHFGPLPEKFSTEAFANKLLQQTGTETTLEKVLKQHRGEKIVIDIWASWCHDCLEGLSELKQLQAGIKEEKLTFLYLSVDEDKERWKRAIQRYDIRGEHFLVVGGWESGLGKFLKLSWIPRYLVVNEDGKIDLYNAIKASDPAIEKAIKREIRN